MVKKRKIPGGLSGESEGDRPADSLQKIRGERKGLVIGRGGKTFVRGKNVQSY